ncbi:MAG: MupG family TIM beta-alpha barrel fold protein [Halanaerobiales bacterium]|nr:MupG family TIM beta-alpha barrel fold protein [Halanaerobiales bacterium]
MLGISVYAGLNLSLEENINYLEEAKQLGIEDVFLSLHIPEVNNNFLSEVRELLITINRLDFNLTADISKKYFDKLNLKEFDFDALRLDFDFDNQEIAELSQNNDYKINLNASTLEESDLKSIIDFGGNLDNLEASHNFYPRKETGLSEQLLVKKNKIFQKYNIEVAAFVPAQFKKRPPLKEGLPTLEKHRFLEPLVAAQDLLKLGVDKVYIGDSRTAKEELKDFAAINKEMTVIPIKISKNLSQEEKRLLKLIHKNRQDPGEYIIRSETARKKKKMSLRPIITAKDLNIP